MRLQLLPCALLAAAILGAVGCGQNPSSTAAVPSEPSPSAALSSPTVSTTGPATLASSRAEVSLTGSITSINAASQSIGVSNTTVSVPSTATIRRGGTRLTFADLAVGDRVSVRGTTSGSTIVAAEVVVDRQPNVPRPVTIEGLVSGLAGSCPSETFTIGASSVATSSSTTYTAGACSTLANGVRVVVRGTRPTSGVIAASSIAIEPARADGALSNLSGTCPAVTFTVRAVTVTTTSATVFSGRTCAELANRVTVHAEGVKQPNASIVASRVESVSPGR